MNEMTTRTHTSLEEILSREYSFNVLADPDGGYVIIFPDLSGCVTQVETLAEIPEMADEARRLWLEVAYEDGAAIPPPSHPEAYSGKFNVRLPRSLHRELVEEADREGVSLNQHVVTLLARRDALSRVERRLTLIEERLDTASAATAAVQ